VLGLYLLISGSIYAKRIFWTVMTDPHHRGLLITKESQLVVDFGSALTENRHR